MKNYFQNALLLLITFVTLMTQVYASERVESAMMEDAEISLDQILVQQNNLRKYKSELRSLDRHLQLRKTGQSIYLQFDTLAGSLVVIGLVVGSYKSYFPPGLRAMVGAYVTVKGISKGLIRLTPLEVKELLSKIRDMNKQVGSTESTLKIKINNLCKTGAYHPLCY